MILLALFIVAAMLAFLGMRAGVYPVLSRCLMGVVSIAAGVGFAGPLRRLIPSDNAYLYGACLLVIGAAVYLILRGLADYFLPERQVDLPWFIDRIGGAVVGFAGALMALGFLCLVLATLPVCAGNGQVAPQLRQAARIAVGTTRAVGWLGGTGERISLEVVVPREPEAQPVGAGSAGLGRPGGSEHLIDQSRDGSATWSAGLGGPAAPERG